MKHMTKYGVIVVIVAVAVAVAATLVKERFATTAGPGWLVPVLAVSLVRHPHRRAALKARAPCVRFVDAVDGADLPPVRGLTRGEAGCFLSHVKAWTRIVDDDVPMALVLEDDAMIRLPEQWDDIRRALGAAPADWDVLFIGHNNQGTVSSGGARGKTLSGAVSVRRPRGDVWGLHAALVRNGGARKLLHAFQTNGGRDDAGTPIPVDVWLGRQEGVTTYVVHPALVYPANIADSETQRTR